MMGTAGGLMMLFAATASIAGNLNGQVLVTARTLFAMAERGQLFSAVSKIHERFHTPHLAILITAGVMLAFAVSGTFVQLATISVGSRARRLRRDVRCPAHPAKAGRPRGWRVQGTCGSCAGHGVAGHLRVAALQQHTTRAVSLHHAGDRRRRGLRGPVGWPRPRGVRDDDPGGDNRRPPRDRRHLQRRSC
jgi:hypothetical protein